MMKWLLLGIFGYLLYKSAGPLLTIFNFNRSVNEKKRKAIIRKKVSKMNIQDAEFEDDVK
tara:strand:- start:419 stop:598 length:180 start_codon:yes stop_codon:yes gene_type:complete